MMELPFEFDSEELIAACIRALEPIAVYEAPSARGAAPLLRPRQPLSPSARGTEAFLRPWERDGEMFETSLFEVLTAVPDQRSGARSR